MTTKMQHPVAGQVVDAVASVLVGAERPVPLHIPDLSGNCGKYVQECIETGWVSSVGAFVDRFEQEIAAYTGARRAVATVNGTAALHIALLMVGVRPGEEVLCPSLTFVATANAITYAGGVPHFVDVDERTLGVSGASMGSYLETIAERREDGLFNRRTGRRIAALIGMHAFGHPFDIEGVLGVCEQLGIPLVEDAAESLGSLYHEQHTGTFGRVGILSFNGNKILTTGGGGMILCRDDATGDWAKHITTTAKLPHQWAYHHDTVGYNYRMPNINAALGCGQLERLETMLEAKRALARRYINALEPVAGVTVLCEPPGTRSNYWFTTMILDKADFDLHEAVMGELHDAGFLVRPIWIPMHRLPMFSHCPRMELPVTEAMATRVVNLPGSVHL